MDKEDNAVTVSVGRLRWRCRRGMRELDQAMLAYVDQHYLSASVEEQARFEELIGMQDPQLFAMVCGRSKEARYQDIIDKMSATLGSAARQNRVPSKAT